MVVDIVLLEHNSEELFSDTTVRHNALPMFVYFLC